MTAGVEEHLAGIKDIGGMAVREGEFVVFGHSEAQAVHSRYLDGDRL